MAYAAVSSLEQHLEQLVIPKIVYLTSDAEKEFRRLEEHVKILRKSVGIGGELSEDMERDIIEGAYEAQDLIDSFIATELDVVKRKSSVYGERIDLARRLSKLRLFRLRADGSASHTKLQSVRRMRSIRRQRDLECAQTVLVFQDEFERLVGQLIENRGEVEVIPIVGKPGVGKTTLASKIFYDCTIVSHFTTRIWINVSEDYDERDFYLDILKAFKTEDLSDIVSVDYLASKTQYYLLQSTFLLVLDEVQNLSNCIRHVLSQKTGSSKVLMTTDKQEVAMHANPNREAHTYLKPWNEEQSSSLLKLAANDDKLDKLPNILHIILGDHVFLPLAIVVIGGLLYHTDAQEMDWIRISEREQDDDDDGEWCVKNLISMSYHNLPYYLRDCFLYFGVFPVNTEISIWKLMHLWIAEGFIEESNSGRTSLEGIAKGYLHELISRNLVMIGTRNYRGELKTCRVHTLIHQFCRYEAKKLNFLRVISSSDFVGTCRSHRVCTHPCNLDVLVKKPIGFHVRSLIFFSNSKYEGDKLSSLRLELLPLRVFEGTSFHFSKFQFKFTKFLLLKYLSLTLGDSFKILPDFIVELWNLETLVINTSSPSFKLVPALSNMKQLRYLKTKAAIVLIMDSNERSSNLEALHRLSTKSCNDNVLSQTPNLRTLSISGDIESIRDTIFLGEKRSLEELKVINEAPFKNVPIPRFLRENQFPPHLRNLTLSRTNLNWDYMRTLGSLLFLEALKLKDNAFRGEEWEVNDGEFSHLRSFQIDGSDLRIWSIKGSHSFKNLRSLSLKNCKKLLGVPSVIPEKILSWDVAISQRNFINFKDVAPYFGKQEPVMVKRVKEFNCRLYVENNMHDSNSKVQGNNKDSVTE